LILFITACLFMYCGNFLSPMIVNVPITFSKRNFPIITVSIEGEDYPLDFSLISKYPLFINTASIDKMYKVRKGEAEWKNIKGEKQTSPLFEIPRIQLGALELKKILMATKDQDPKDRESFGSVAWPFEKMNLLLDLPHHRIAGIKSKKDLIANGCDIGKMEKVKCKITKKGVFFRASTSLGDWNILLTTSGNANIVNIANCKEENENKNCLTIDLKIGNANFREIELWPIEITEELEVNAILATEFLRSHIIYVDAQNEYLYIGERYANTLMKSSLSKIPVAFTFNGLPVIEIKMQKKKRSVIVDLGSSWELLLTEDNFSSDGMRYIDKGCSINAIGTEEDTDCYSFSECKIGNSVLKNLFVHKKKEIGVSLGIKGEKIGSISQAQLGCIGRPLLHRANIYFDFPNSALWLVQEELDLKKIDVKLKEHEKIHFKLENCGIVLNIKSNLGDLRLLLDTGCGASLLKPEFLNEANIKHDSFGNPYYLINTFVLGNCDYGNTKFYPFDVSPKIENIDGILGMDFLKEHAFYIDYPNRLIYFQKPLLAESCSKEKAS